MTFPFHLLMENSINYLYPILTMQTVSSVLVDKQPHAAPAPPRAVRAEVTESVVHGNRSPVEDESFTTS